MQFEALLSVLHEERIAESFSNIFYSSCNKTEGRIDVVDRNGSNIKSRSPGAGESALKCYSKVVIQAAIRSN